MFFWSEAVLTPHKRDSAGFPFCKKSQNSVSEIVSIAMDDKPIEDLLTREWLLTNEHGGYTSSTIVGCNTRRYHGLLIGSLNRPVNRIVALANCLEMVIVDGDPGNIFNLSTFEFSDKFAPAGFRYIKRFRRDVGVHFDYQLVPACPEAGTAAKAGIELTKSIYLLRDMDTVVLVYDFTNVQRKVEFTLRPFIGLRGFHTLQKSYAEISSSRLGDGLLIRHNMPQSCELFLSCPAAEFEEDEQWWFNFVYRQDKERGQNFTEDLWTPGFFKCGLDSPTKIVLWANTRSFDCRLPLIESEVFNWQLAIENLHEHQESVRHKARSVKHKVKSEKRDTRFSTLCLAADQFVVKWQTDGLPTRRTTILAGFPWFADWGRDTFIALPGLLLSTGRFEEAKSILTSFAQAADEGMIPNRFDDNSDTAYFNSVDASLWFINAAFQYLYAAGDCETFEQDLLPTIHWIIDSYYNGTRFGICADADGLITAGNDDTQLTWMDAKYNGVAITARYGKAVEINALWYNSLCYLAQFYAGRDIEAAKHYKSIAERSGASFCELFWNEKNGYLNDCILPGGLADSSLRPNQIFAVSLPFSPLSAREQASVVGAVQKSLLTPYGLRTLSVADNRYKGRYTGPQQQRDEAYHQGTVWPYLIGPFVEAYLKVNGFSRKSKRKAADFIEPLMQHLTEDGCVGQLCEIFDGDAPRKPRGCIAQAWSVAELMRAYQLIND